MRTIRYACWLALPAAALLWSLNVAGAQGSDEARQACTPDAMRLCSEFIPDVEKVKKCMFSKRSQLSQACRVAIGGAAKTGRHAARRHKGHVHCRHGHHCG